MSLFHEHVHTGTLPCDDCGVQLHAHERREHDCDPARRRNHLLADLRLELATGLLLRHCEMTSANDPRLAAQRAFAAYLREHGR